MAGARVLIDDKEWPEVKHLTRQVVAARKAAGFTQKQAADVIGTAQSYVAALEKGYINPSFLALAQLARAYRVPMSSFVSDKTYKKRPTAPKIRSSQKPNDSED